MTDNGCQMMGRQKYNRWHLIHKDNVNFGQVS